MFYIQKLSWSAAVDSAHEEQTTYTVHWIKSQPRSVAAHQQQHRLTPITLSAGWLTAKNVVHKKLIGSAFNLQPASSNVNSRDKI